MMLMMMHGPLGAPLPSSSRRRPRTADRYSSCVRFDQTPNPCADRCEPAGAPSRRRPRTAPSGRTRRPRSSSSRSGSKRRSTPPRSACNPRRSTARLTFPWRAPPGAEEERRRRARRGAARFSVARFSVARFSVARPRARALTGGVTCARAREAARWGVRPRAPTARCLCLPLPPSAPPGMHGPTTGSLRRCPRRSRRSQQRRSESEPHSIVACGGCFG